MSNMVNHAPGATDCPPANPQQPPSHLTATTRLSRTAFSYTSCYCEENVYLLIERLLGHSQIAANEPPLPAGDRYDLFAVFISNANRSIPLWNHWDRSTEQPRTVCWDYHVICVARPKARPQNRPAADLPAPESIVLDLDTALPFPTRFTEYAIRALRIDLQFDAKFERSYRVIQAAEYVSHFSSDRRHMRKPNSATNSNSDVGGMNTGHGDWIMPPPNYPPIRGAQAYSEHELGAFIDMTAGMKDAGRFGRVPGIVLNQDEFIDMFLGCEEEVGPGNGPM